MNLVKATLGRWFGSNMIYGNRPYVRTTTASRRAERRASEKYTHVSVPVIKTPEPLVPFFGEFMIAKPKGITYRNGNNALKANADNLAADLGMNNKQRCSLRASMKRRANELRAAS